VKTFNNFAIAAACSAMAFTLPVTATADDEFSVKVGGRLQFDAAAVDSDDGLLQNFSGSEFRRVRTFVKGKGFGNLDYKVQIDFAQDGEIDFKDVYVRLAALGGKFWLGNYHQPFGMAEITSSKYTDFMERSMASQSIDIDRARSVGYSWNNDSVWWMASVFSQQNDEGDGDQHESVGVAARVTYSPVHTDTNVLHFGASVAQREEGNFNGIRYRTNYHVMDNRIDVRGGAIEAALADAGGDFDTAFDGPTQFALEFAGAWGPVTAKAEYLGLSSDLTLTDNTNGQSGDTDYDVDGAYVNLLYTIGYNPAKAYSVSKGGVFDRIKANNVWQVGVRYDFLNTDIDDIEVESESITIGGTYILNPYTRFKGEVVFAETEISGEDFQDDTVFQVRTQIDF